MSFFYVTGISGIGKSQVLKELRARGYEAYGTDEDGFARWINKSNHKIELLPENRPQFDIHKWFAEHDWVLDKIKVSKLMTRANTIHKPIFLCGLADGEDKVWYMFTKVFLLKLDESVLRKRILERTDNDFGKAPSEIKSINEWLSKNEKRYQDMGAIPLDASQPVSEVVDDIITSI